MGYEFACKDIGMDCDFKVSGKTKEELMPKIAEHAKDKHKIDQIPPDLMQKIQKAIKKVK